MASIGFHVNSKFAGKVYNNLKTKDLKTKDAECKFSGSASRIGNRIGTKSGGQFTRASAR